MINNAVITNEGRIGYVAEVLEDDIFKIRLNVNEYGNFRKNQLIFIEPQVHKNDYKPKMTTLEKVYKAQHELGGVILYKFGDTYYYLYSKGNIVIVYNGPDVMKVNPAMVKKSKWVCVPFDVCKDLTT